MKAWILIGLSLFSMINVEAQKSGLSDVPLAAATTLSAAPSAGLDPFARPLIRTVQTRHDLGIAGDKKEVISLLADLEKWTKESPHDSLLLAYLGSTKTLRSRDAFPGPSKLRYLKEGLKAMDDAVEKDPTNLATRFIRGVNNYQLPAFINRRDNARVDFKILVTELSKPNTAVQLNAATKQAIFFYAGLAYQQSNESDQALLYWRQGVALDPTTELARKTNSELSKLRP
jgi:tetratricopeptide (TPR) repeat protein